MISPVKEGTECDNAAALMKLSAGPEKGKRSLRKEKKGKKLTAMYNIHACGNPQSLVASPNSPYTEGT